MSEIYNFHSHKIFPVDCQLLPLSLQTGKNPEFWDHFLMLEPNSERLKSYQIQFEVIKQHYFPHLPFFSWNDFVLAFIGAETGTTIISHDRHLLKHLHRYLEYECIFPNELSQYSNADMYLVDANIIIAAVYEKPESKLIFTMFQHAKQKTFLLPIFIWEEIVKFVEDSPSNSIEVLNFQESKWLISPRYRSVFQNNYE